MTKEVLSKVVQRAISDGAFRRQLANDPNTALRGFDLTPNESAAIRSGDAGRLSALGVDVRMSKAFTLAGGESVANSLTPADISTGEGAMTPGDAAAGGSVLSTGENAGHQVVQWDGSDDAVLGGRNEANDAGGAAHALGATTPAGGDNVLSSGDDSDQYLSSVNYAQTGGDTAHNAIISDDGPGGAGTPGEASEGPNIQP
jgi:hypothetical protein